MGIATLMAELYTDTIEYDNSYDAILAPKKLNEEKKIRGEDTWHSHKNFERRKKG